MSLEAEDAAAEVTRENWRSPPFSRWAFHHIADVLPTAPIAAAPGEALPAASVPAALDGFSLRALGGTTLDLAGYLTATATDALVILRHGEIVHETYANGNDVGTPHILMSASKAMIGLLCGLLEASGDLDLTAPVTDLVPEMAGGGYDGASLRDLIDMRAGVMLDEAQTAAYTAIANADPAAPGLHDFLKGLRERQRPHGGVFSYISANTDLVGWAIERATGRTVPDLLSQRLWRPMGAADGGYMITDREGAAWCSGGVCATARDLARVGALIAAGGRRGDAQVMPAAWIEALHGGGDRGAWRDGEWGQAFGFIGREMSYRAGWYLVHDQPDQLFAMGIHGQNLFIDRAEGLVIAKLSSQPQRFDPATFWLTHKGERELRRVVLAG